MAADNGTSVPGNSHFYGKAVPGKEAVLFIFSTLSERIIPIRLDLVVPADGAPQLQSKSGLD